VTAPTDDTGCSGGESFALRVLGDSMAPECQGEWTFRQLNQVGEQWCLHALNPAYADQALPDLSTIHGVIIQKAVPGRRRLTKHYI
jgi:DNA polymerase V